MNEKPLGKLSVVVPARNEAGNVAGTVRGLRRELTQAGIDHEIVVVDDGSTDDTRQVVAALGADVPELRLVENTGAHGFGRAVACGLDAAVGDAVVIYMADASDSPADVVAYWQKLNEGYDCVFGSRFIRGSKVVDYPLHKLILNRVANAFIRLLFRFDLNDTTNAFKAYRREVIEGCRPFLSPHFNLTVELPLKAIVRGYSWTVIPISWHNRKEGVSKLKINEMGDRYLFIVLYMWLERTFVPHDYERPQGQSACGAAGLLPRRGAFLALLGVLAVCALVRLIGLHTYPVLAVDEGLWTLQARDLVLFGDPYMNGLRQMFLSPLHFATTWGLFLFAPATCFSVRGLNAVVGLLSVYLLWRWLAAEMGTSRSLWVAALVGLSFTMSLVNRRAYLESGVILFSVASAAFAVPASRRRLPLLAVGVAALLLYKSNACYLLPCLLVPASGERFLGGAARRLGWVAVGVCLALGVFVLVSRVDTEGFVGAFRFELQKGDAAYAVFRVGRFGLFPGYVRESLVGLVRGNTDLAVLSAIALVGAPLAGMFRQRLMLKLWLWLLIGYAFLLAQGFQHSQFFVPLIVPAGALTVLVVTRLAGQRGVIRVAFLVAGLLFCSLNVMRVGYGWLRAREQNPPLEAVRWLEGARSSDSAILTCPEIAAAREWRSYAFHRIFRPYEFETAPSLGAFVREKGISTIVMDDWESPSLLLGREFAAELAGYEAAGNGTGWTAYDTRRDEP